MSDTRITDGTGDCHTAKVDESNRLHTRSVSSSDYLGAIYKGNGYYVGTPSITLTSANPSAIFYFKNNEDSNLVIQEFVVDYGVSTGGSGDISTFYISNPTAGTLIDNAVEAGQVNYNFGSSHTLDVAVYSGVEGDSITAYKAIAPGIEPEAPISRVYRNVFYVIPKGQSLGFMVTPPAGNTSMNIRFGLSCYLEEGI